MMRIHRAGFQILFQGAIVLLGLNLIIWSKCSHRLRLLTGLVSALIYGILIRFFRVPSRLTDHDPCLIYAPADGKIVAVEAVREGQFLNTECVRVSIYLSLLDAHITVSPVNGLVTKTVYQPGKYLLAFHPKASELNEQQIVVMQALKGKQIMLRLIAGWIARRICTYAVEGQTLRQGDEIGFIKFGSRVDVLLPADVELLVGLGARVKAGVTQLARWPE